MIRFRCACGKRVKVSASAAGRRVRCPSCGKEQRAPRPRPSRRVPDSARPGVPVAEVVAEVPQTPASAVSPPGEADGPEPAGGLAALAHAVKTNGGPAARRDFRGGAPNRAKQQDLPTTAQLIARRTGAVTDGRKYFLIGIGAALGLILIVVMLAVLAGRGGPESPSAAPADAPPAGQTARRGAGSPGELFPNVPPEGRSE